MEDTRNSFYTESGYAKMDAKALTPAAEDYLEMIYRISNGGESPVRVGELSEHLHVTPSSASRMASFMGGVGFVNFKRYGYITLTDSGKEKGEYLIHRHEVVNRFLSFLKKTEDETAETERIEHYLSPTTVKAMEEYLEEKAKSQNLPNEKPKGTCISPQNRLYYNK